MEKTIITTLTNYSGKTKTIVLAIFCCLLWASAFAGVKICLQYWPPLTLAGIRFMIAGVLLVPFWLTRVEQPFLQIRQNVWRLLLVSLLQTILLYGLFNSGMALVPGGIAAIVTGTSPLTMAVVAHAVTSDDKLSWRKSICLLIAFAGIAVIAISRKSWQGDGGLEIVGMLMLVLAGLSGAFGNLAVRKLRIDPFMLNSVQIFIGGVVLLASGLCFEGVPEFQLPFTFYLGFGWLALLSAVAFSLWFYLLHQPGIKPSELNMWKFIIPVFGAIFSWVILQDENPGIGAIVGMVCVAGALVFYSIEPRKLK
ncbi:MAG: EamA family transporter [Victivallaceae bacterium]|nr:EamA family transporter [Victivallaceae bacterium]